MLRRDASVRIRYWHALVVAYVVVRAEAGDPAAEGVPRAWGALSAVARPYLRKGLSYDLPHHVRAGAADRHAGRGFVAPGRQVGGAQTGSQSQARS